MLTREQYFPGHAPGEEVALFIRRHWMAFFPWIVFGPTVLIAIFTAALALWLPQNSLLRQTNDYQVIVITVATGLLYIVVFALLRAWMSYYLDVTIVTERRLVDIEQRGIFVRRIAEQSLLRVQDVSARQHGFFQHFFNYGALYIETAGQQQNFELKNIPRPNDVATTILNLHERLVATGKHEAEEVTAEGEYEPVTGMELPSVRGPRHPLAELQPYFPEPGRRRVKSPSPAHPSAGERAAPVGPEEGELREGETVSL